ncbi:splicing factor, suppressor of white-apricot homolog isoform X2 [Copidosoma floridanum]|uniref:splicing factor, suppressor of white-apricot homolog isoform X2 n=1 Tax=Copidosoma floridanum TaxID=29053 RepID=UPI0006C9AEE6|nr:splicing factor, suppressor of white-apricot homolog isoform X2 [Copidosoma floridanum]
MASNKSQRWVVDSGILRKKAEEEDLRELLVFGYGCKLFRDDEKAKLIDQGKHLIPWMGDDTLRIDRYDGRGALGDLRIYEPPQGGFDLRTILSEDEYKVEQLCDQERYKSLYNNEAEEAMYHEEEIKRLHQALDSENSYSQVAFNYDEEKKLEENSESPKPSEDSQEDEAFEPDPELEIPGDMIVPETQKLNAIIVKTALFISHQGGQMEVLIKTKQADNPQFSFLSIDGELYPYYKHLLQAIKSGKYNPEKQPDKEEPAPEEEAEEEQSDDDDEPYLHPSLVSSLKIEAAPSIPSINYKPSADCAYSMLVNKITGKPPTAKTALKPEVIPPPPLPPMGYYHPMSQGYPPYQAQPQQYTHGPVLYNANGNAPAPQLNQTPAVPQYSSSAPVQPAATVPPAVQTPQKELPAPLVPYGPTPPKPLSRPSFIVPPADVQIIIDKMASYVAKNGRDFEAIVKNKGDPRFNFLELSHQYHGYYAHKLTMCEGAVNPRVLTDEELLQKQELQEEKQKKLQELEKKQQRMEEVQKRVKMIQEKKKGEIGTNRQSPSKQVTTVSFSIKKPKEGENTVIEKRNALPQEESDDEEASDDNEKKVNNKSESPAPTVEEKVAESVPSPKKEKESKKIPDKPVTKEKKRKTPTTTISVATTTTTTTTTASEKPVVPEKRTQPKPAVPPTKPQPNLDKPLHPEKKLKPSKPAMTLDITDIVDLTDDVFDDCELIHTNPTAEDRAKHRAFVAARAKLNVTRERQLQMERRRKAAMFLSQIQAPTIARKDKPAAKPEPRQLAPPALLRQEPVVSVVPVSFGKEELEELRMCTNSLMSKLRPLEVSRRSKPRSRSRSSSDGHSERHRSHKKHKKKKSSHKRENISSSRSHKSKKSKKSSSRHRERSRSSHRHYTSSRHRRESSSSDSDTSSS